MDKDFRTELKRLEVLGPLEFSVLKDLFEGSLSVTLDAAMLAQNLEVNSEDTSAEVLCFEVPFTQKRRGIEARFFMSGSALSIDKALTANIAKRQDWLRRIKKGETFAEIADLENTTKKRVQQMLDYAFLAPDIVRDVLAGKQPIGLTSTWIATHFVPSDWAEQRELITTL
ncbi:hypothetical protein SAMN05444000_1443 [Shimia gijangensis]|uniref:Uncharacterized protein n=1 Tax=Shimia gijangensis TaxID=1470563 RepID=A0A1M6TRM5_9RHOB|nr:hypothetical protein [Shimia gijangensis]SHK59539.1 hypothetical protein SAMN05444000_1443 [Shimia gijangensis]